MNFGLEAGAATQDLASELGIRGVPISAAQLVNDGVAATLATLKERGLTVCQIGAFGFNPLRANENERQILERAIPLAAETGCPYLVINSGNYHASAFTAVDPRNFTEAALDEMARTLTPIVQLAERYGAKITLEAINKAAVGTPERFLALREKVGSDALRCNVDPTSLYDFADLLNPAPFVAHLCAALAGHYGLVHIKEVALAEGFHLHADLAPLGAGNTDWAQFLAAVAPRLPDDSWAILEHCQTPEETRASVALLRDAAKRVGVTLN